MSEVKINSKLILCNPNDLLSSCKVYFEDRNNNLILSKEEIVKPDSFKEVPNIQIAITYDYPRYKIGYSFETYVLRFDEENNPYLKEVITSFIKVFIEDPSINNALWIHTNNSYYLTFFTNKTGLGNDLRILTSKVIPEQGKKAEMQEIIIESLKIKKRLITPEEVTIESKSSNLYKITEKGINYLVIVKN